MTLSSWFRDYLYIPLGGSRCARRKVMANTMIIFLVSGLWHGANWTFVVWGAYHALLFFPLMLLGTNRKYTGAVAAWRRMPSVGELGQMLLTFLLVVAGWIVFRAESIGQAWDYLNRMCSPSLFQLSMAYGKRAGLYAAVLLTVEWLQRDKQHALQIDGTVKVPALRWCVYYMLVLSVLFLQGTQAEFIYFQF